MSFQADFLPPRQVGSGVLSGGTASFSFLVNLSPGSKYGPPYVLPQIDRV